jgi:menaquinol-cytochrome c reductase cytochrome b subunit
VPRLIDRLLDPFDERLDIRARFSASIGSRTVPTGARRYWYCFGGLAFFTALMQALSGMFLAFYYQPTPDKAYASVFYISNYVHYGWLIRSVHLWGSRLMIALVVFHMARVFITASYNPPREFNWVAGTLLFALTMAFAITGDLLPWDQRGYWSTKAMLELVQQVPVIGHYLLDLVSGGQQIGAATLTRFYAGHIMLLPAVFTALLLVHFWMIRKQGIARPL